MTKTNPPARSKNLERTVQAILNLLKREGPSNAGALASRLKISDAAVRQHLYSLRDRRLVTSREEPRPMGRPAKLWRLTSNANRFFPDAHAELTLSLIQCTETTFGKDGLNRVVAQSTQQRIEQYQKRIPERGPLERRLKALVSLRNQEGYMVEIRSLQDGSFLLVQNHCPISKVVEICSQICAAELEVFQTVLGKKVSIERREHMLADSRRCVYLIRNLTAREIKQQ